MRQDFQSAYGPGRLLAWIGIFIVLVAGSVQACHICGLDGGDAAPHTFAQQVASSSAPNFCSICLSTQPATSAVPVMAQAPAQAIEMVAVSAPTSFYPNDRLFSLYIRPPPSL